MGSLTIPKDLLELLSALGFTLVLKRATACPFKLTELHPFTSLRGSELVACATTRFPTPSASEI